MAPKTSTHSRVGWPRSFNPLDPIKALLSRSLGENRNPNVRVTPITHYAKALDKPATRPLGRLEPVRIPLYTAALASGALAAIAGHGPKHDWRTALFSGLVSGTFSTLIITLGAPVIGRDAAVDWMELAPVWLGSGTIESKPTLPVMAAGVTVHATADIAWATLLFGAWGNQILEQSPLLLIAITPPWAVVTSMIEYYGILPWLQPLVTRQVPYWTALSVHLLSGMAYSMFPVVEHLAGFHEVPPAHQRLAKLGAVAMAGSLATIGGLFLLQRAGRSPKWPLLTERGRDFDRSFLYRMTGHHVAGVKLAKLAVEKTRTEDLCVLAHLEVAQQEADIKVMRAWWRGWFGGEIPPLSQEDYASMVGMPHPVALEELATLEGDDFERRFIELMVPHHHGAIIMANNAVSQAGDPRLRTLGDSIRHSQQSQVERMLAQPTAPEETLTAAGLYEATSPDQD